ncbi:hypothetical protein DCAR_0311749 [Daucus carota subsp. sativus]|uniref:DUF8040 domain-containing protein n=1 Tax=Daucus carota subsp. sativus TaxID=79200 RepID=A0AAF0WM86_DAUCS|nr:hypothetical protein DCAR_0311749 [Daucus carota subsp. sativus]
MIHEPIHRSLTRRPVTRLRYRFVNNLMKEDPHNFRDYTECIIIEGASLEDTRFVSVEEIVATFSLIVGHNDRYSKVRQMFNHSHFATSVSFKISESKRFYPYFKDCVGAVDGTHIPAMVRGREVSSYRNEHDFNSQNGLATCNFDLEFIYILNGCEGKYFFVDCGFANRCQFLAPLCGVRYHLKDFDGEGRHPKNANDLFNLRHSSLRNSRFTILEVASPFSLQTQAELVLACVGLHNFFQKECLSDEFSVESTYDQFSDMDDDFMNQIF